VERGGPGTIVEESNLTVQIAALRKALRKTPDGQERREGKRTVLLGFGLRLDA